MWQGSVVSISIAPAESEPTRLMDEVRVIAGRGLEGDRYCKPDGEAWEDPGKEITLIAVEAIDAMSQEFGVDLEYKDARRNIITRDVPLNDLIDKEFAVDLEYKDARRNIITRDVPLNDLVDREFTVGDVRLKGIRLNQPCQHLASLTDQKVLKGLVDRGGLRAQILNDGQIRVGDTVQGQ